MRKRNGHSDDDPDCDSNSANGAGVDKHSDNGGDNRQQRKVQAVPDKSYEKRWPDCNLEDNKAVTQEDSSQLSATAKQHTTVNKKQRGGGGGDDGDDGYTKQNGRTMRKRS